MEKQENSPNIMSIPVPPLFNLPPPKLDDHSYTLFYQRRNLMLINGESQFSNEKDQISVKHKDKFLNSQKNSTESQSNGQAYINITLYGLCQRCNNWIQKKQKETHLTFHAAIILNNLFLGDKFSSQSRKQLLQRLKVTHVVNAATQIKNYFQNEGVVYLKLDLFDDLSEDVIPQCLKAAQFIKKAHDEGGNVFVHCAMGKSRSVSAILMYLIIYHKMTLEESLSLVKSKRPIARPNLSYMKQLKQFEEKRIGINKNQ